MKYFSMFSGIGGFELGIGDLAECIGYSEIDSHAIKTYEEHFDHENFGDAATIDPDRLPGFDLIVGGFPCQSFSIAGARGGFDDTRGTLFFEIARIMRVKRPRLCVFENVKGLLSHDRGRTFDTIIRTLDELGYDLQWQVLNSKDFGVPQNRERIYIVGHLRGSPPPQVFPITETNQQAIVQLNQPNHSNDRFYGADGISPTLNTGSGGLRQPKIIAPHIRFGHGERTTHHSLEDVSPTIRATHYKAGDNQPLILEAPNGKEIDLTETPDQPAQLLEVRTDLGKATRREIREREGRDSTKRGRADKKYIPKQDGLANALTTGPGNIEKWIVDLPVIRRLTPLECERLQSFPDNWTLGRSDTQRYKQCGNAVTVNVVKAVMERLLK